MTGRAIYYSFFADVFDIFQHLRIDIGLHRPHLAGNLLFVFVFARPIFGRVAMGASHA